MPDRKHSAFSYYFLEGLRGADMCVNDKGYVTPESLGKYIDLKITELPDKRQEPIRKTQASGDIALAYYPEKDKASQSIDNSAQYTDIGRRKAIFP